MCIRDSVKVKGIIGQCKVVLCSRFHGCVSALSQGVACIGTSWSYKYERLFEDYDRRNFLLTSPVVEDSIEQLIKSGQSEQGSDNRQKIADLKVRSNQMWEHVSKAVFDIAQD